MKVTINVAGDTDEIADYVHHVANQISEGYLSGFEGNQGNAWSLDNDNQ